MKCILFINLILLFTGVCSHAKSNEKVENQSLEIKEGATFKGFERDGAPCELTVVKLARNYKFFVNYVAAVTVSHAPNEQLIVSSPIVTKNPPGGGYPITSTEVITLNDAKHTDDGLSFTIVLEPSEYHSGLIQEPSNLIWYYTYQELNGPEKHCLFKNEIK